MVAGSNLARSKHQAKTCMAHLPGAGDNTAGFAFRGSQWKLTFYEVPDAQPALECMAFAVECNGRKFVHSGAVGLCADQTELTRSEDLLIHCCYRLDVQSLHPDWDPPMPSSYEIGGMAKAVGVRTVLLTRLRTEIDTHTLDAL